MLYAPFTLRNHSWSLGISAARARPEVRLEELYSSWAWAQEIIGPIYTRVGPVMGPTATEEAQALTGPPPLSVSGHWLDFSLGQLRLGKAPNKKKRSRDSKALYQNTPSENLRESATVSDPATWFRGWVLFNWSASTSPSFGDLAWLFC